MVLILFRCGTACIQFMLMGILNIIKATKGKGEKKGGGRARWGKGEGERLVRDRDRERGKEE